MIQPALPHPDTTLGKKEKVMAMFNRIAPRYDLLNHLLSAGIDRRWRRKAVNTFSGISPAGHILDVATGTGDMAIIAATRLHTQVTGIDISTDMLHIGEKKVESRKLTNKIRLQKEDSENMNFEENTFDGVMVAFGVRNFENLGAGIQEMHRVIKRGARVVVLEFSVPENRLLNRLYSFYFQNILPAVGKFVSKDPSAYTYLPESVMHFPEGDKFIRILENAGFTGVTRKPLTFGICTLYTGIK